jgi:hypothetical protein
MPAKAFKWGARLDPEVEIRIKVSIVDILLLMRVGAIGVRPAVSAAILAHRNRILNRSRDIDVYGRSHILRVKELGTGSGPKRSLVCLSSSLPDNLPLYLPECALTTYLQ